MTQKQAKEWWPLLEALRDGKTIQYKYVNKYGSVEWIDIESPNWSNGIEYRVKPEKKAVPFNSAEEFYTAWCLQRPYIVVMDSRNDTRYCITYFNNLGIYIAGTFYTYEQLLEHFTFADGTPCGKVIKD